MKYKKAMLITLFIGLLFTHSSFSEASFETDLCELLGTCDEPIHENSQQDNNENIAERTCGKNSIYTTNRKCSCISGYIWEDMNDINNLNCIVKKQDTDIDRILCELEGTCEETINTNNNQNYIQGLKGKNCGRNSIYINNTKCNCIAGYQWEKSNDKNNFNCVKKNQKHMCNFKGKNYLLPQNAYCVSNNKYNAWLCNQGYREVGNSCIKNIQQQVCDIKGNISYYTGEKIYHTRGCENYADTKINTRYGERYFCSEYEAQQAGWRKARNCY